MLRPLAVLLGLVSVLGAQSVSISSPTPAQIVSGFQLDLQVSFAGLPSLYSVEYLLDQRHLSSVRKAPYSYLWSTNEIWNGRHTVQAVAKDVTGNVLATSPETAFTVANGSDTIVVTPSTPATSAWNGIVSFAVSITRSDGVDSNCYLYVDGVYQSTATGGASCMFFLDTAGFENGPHYIFVQASNAFTNTPRGMWAHEVTFANAPTMQVGLRAGLQELFLTPGQTATLTPTLVLADSSTISSSTNLPVSDDFNRSNESPLAGNWTASEGSINLSGNALTGNSNEANAGYFWNQDTFPADQYAELKITAFGAGSHAGPAVRMQTSGTYYTCTWDGATMYLSRRLNGVTVNPASKGKTASAGDVIRLEVSGQSPVSLVCKVNGIVELTYADADSSRILYGQAGVGTYRDTGATRGDDWSAGALSGGNPSALFFTSNPSVATVNASGEVTGVAAGDCDITVFSRGRTTAVRATVNASSALPHFGTDGAILNAYDPAKSFLMRSWFFAGRDQLNAYPNAIQDYRNGGANTWEEGMYFSPTDGETQTAWTTRIDGHYSALTNFANTSGLKMLGTGDGMARLNMDLYKSTRGVWRTWVPDPVTYAFTKARDSGFFVGVEMVDEVNAAHGNTPFPQGLVNASGPFTQIVCTATTPPNSICTVHWTKFSGNGGSLFIISGATSDADLNSASGSLYSVVSAIDSNRYTFNATNVGTRTFDASTDPSLQIEMLASQWVGTDYVRLNAFSTLMSAINSVPNRTKITWPVAAGSDQYTRQNWLGDPQISDYATIFWAATARRTPWGQSLPDLINDMRTFYRDFYAVIQRDKPWTTITPAAGPMYKIGGVLKNVASISGGMAVFSEPHEVSRLIPGTTRIRVGGNSGVNGDFYVTAIPTATTMKLAYKNPIQTGTGFGGTATFETGHVFNVVSFGIPAVGDPVLAVNDPGGCPLPNLLHKRFVLSGSSAPALNREWYFARPSGGSCTLTGLVREVPDGTGTDGSAYVISSNAYVAGRNQLMVPGISTRAVLAGFFYPILQGAAGARVYGLSNVDPEEDAAASSWFQNEPLSGDGVNFNSSPRHAANGMQARWSSLVAAMRVTGLLEKFLLQPRLHAPDYGPQLQCTVRQGNFGRLLACLNYTEGTVNRTISLSPYSHGTTITRYRVTDKGMNTLTLRGPDDTLTLEPAEVVIYVMPVNEDVPPPIHTSHNRNDVPQATQTVVEWAYDPTLLDRQGAPVVCADQCVLPVDIRMGPVSYRYHYLDSANQVLATSDVMVIAKQGLQ